MTGSSGQRSCKLTQLAQFVHDIVSNKDGAMFSGQADLIIMNLAKHLTRFHTGVYYTN